MPPTIATTSPSTIAAARVVPATCLTFSTLRAPQAWPISTVDPAESPIRKLIRKNMIGKKVAVAASASTPIICPT
ncbi:hypothetical protein D3C87_1723140 [compost metagenome]